MEKKHHGELSAEEILNTDCDCYSCILKKSAAVLLIDRLGVEPLSSDDKQMITDALFKGEAMIRELKHEANMQISVLGSILANAGGSLEVPWFESEERTGVRVEKDGDRVSLTLITSPIAPGSAKSQ